MGDDGSTGIGQLRRVAVEFGALADCQGVREVEEREAQMKGLRISSLERERDKTRAWQVSLLL